MDRHQLQIVINFDGIVGSLQPQALMHQPERSRVVGFFELNVTVAVQLHLNPLCKLWRDIRQGLQHQFFGLSKQCQRLLPGGSMDAVAGCLHQPTLQLSIGIAERAELTQGYEVVFDVFNP